jgi:hypothetical protein
MKYRVLSLCLALSLSSIAAGQTTQPAIDVHDPRVELRANQAFNRGEYSSALPLLTALANAAQNDPVKAGALQEKIRVCRRALDALAQKSVVNPAAAAAVGAPADIPMDAETRRKHAPPQPGQVEQMTIKELGNFQYDPEKGGNIPTDVRQMSGATIRLKGYMIPMDQADRITQFALVPSLFACCFGQPPQIQHTIVVDCPKGKAVAYCPDEIIVEGQLTVEEKKDDGYVISIFEMGAKSVKVAPR